MTTDEYVDMDEAVMLITTHVQKKLADIGASSEFMPTVAGDLLSLWEEEVETVRVPGSRPTHIAALKWVIRNDDLKILDTVLDGLKASSGAGFFVLADRSISASIVAAAGLFAGVVKLAYNAVSKGVVLSSRDYSIIAALFDQDDGLTKEDLLSRLLLTQSNWTIDDVQTGLASLSETPSRNGKIQLVWKSADDRWRTTGV